MSLHLKSFAPDSVLVHRVHPAVNSEDRRDGLRPYLVILHYTGMSSADKAINWLACEESQVSCHYVIDESGLVTQLVPEHRRAWHAGVSSWQGLTDINSRSIGIEIQNPGHADGYPDFPRRQIDTVVALTRDICERNLIAPAGVLAHSDIAIARKIDPGEKFPWSYLARQGVGHWVRPSPLREDAGNYPFTANEVDEARRLLKAYGYEIAAGGAYDEAMSKVVMAFQRHFRPAKVDGRLDGSTLQTLRRLVTALSPSLTLRQISAG